MHLSLSPTWQRYIEAKVNAGEYASPEEVVHAGLASLARQAQLDATYPPLRAGIAEGLRDARAGRVSDGESFFDELDRDELS